MAHGDDLPDVDYESIYGAEALAARRRARLCAIAQTVRDLEQHMDERNRAWQHEHD
jgi:hypothetical protein